MGTNESISRDEEDTKDFARKTFRLYCHLIVAGFTSEQAFELVKVVCMKI